MSWKRDKRFWRAIVVLIIVWLCGITERVLSIGEGAFGPVILGDIAGLAGALLVGIGGRIYLRGIEIAPSVRRILAIAWVLFTTYSLSDVLDEFLFPPDNIFLGKEQFVHRTIEIMLWSGGFVMAVAGLFAAIVDGARARQSAREERVRVDASERETEKTQGQLALFAHAIEQATDSFVLMDLQGTLIYANGSFEDLMTLPRGAAVGKTAADLIREYNVTPADMFDIALREGRWNGEVVARRADGVLLNASVALVLFRDKSGVPVGVAGLASDITQRLALETALRQSEERYRLIVENATDLISIHTRDSEWLLVSPSSESILGYAPEELLGTEAYAIMDPSHATDLNNLEPVNFLDPHPSPINLVLCHKDGHPVHLESKIRTLTSADPAAEPQLLVMSRDVTERLAQEEQRRGLEARIQEAQRQEGLAMLAGGIAHDFNNLLLVILANADLLAAERGEITSGSAYVEGIRAAAERAGDLTRQLLAYAGRGELRHQELDLGRTVVEMSSLIQASLPRLVTIERDIAQGLPLLRGDVVELRQVVLNLITNAAEAIGTQAGTIQIRTGVRHCTRDELKACLVHDHLPEGNYVFLQVRDTGHGMDEKTRQRMFDPFFTTKFQGRGIGLAAVSGIVRRHHAALAVESAPGAGTTVTVYFPAA